MALHRGSAIRYGFPLLFFLSQNRATRNLVFDNSREPSS